MVKDRSLLITGPYWKNISDTLNKYFQNGNMVPRLFLAHAYAAIDCVKLTFLYFLPNIKEL